MRSALALALSLVLAAGTLPAAMGAAAPGEVEGGRFCRHGGELFRLDFAGLQEAGPGLPDEGGDFLVALSRAVYRSSPGEGGRESRGFSFAEGGRETPFVDLGEDLAGALRGAGRATPPERWEEVVTWSVSATGRAVTSTFRVGVDWVSLTLPREALQAGRAELPEDAIITLEANGIATRMDRALLEEMHGVDACGGEAAARESRVLQRMADSFVDLPTFLNHVRGYLEIERQFRVQQAVKLLPGDDDSSLSSCATLCLSCAGALLASVGAYVALISTCGGALVTGGTTAVLCIASFIGVQSSHLIVFASCARCVECAGQPDCPCEGEPLCDCD